MDSVPDFGDSELDRQKLISVHAVAFLLVIYALAAALDVADLFWSIGDPGAVARLACLVQPLALVKVPLLWPSPIPDACIGQVQAPAISLVFFSAKMTIAFFVIVVLWVFMSPDGLGALRDIYWRRFEIPGGFRNEVKTFAKNSLGIFVFLSCCFFLAAIAAADSKSQFILGAKFVLEDGLTIAIPAMALDFIAKASLFGSFAWTHRGRV